MKNLYLLNSEKKKNVKFLKVVSVLWKNFISYKRFYVSILLKTFIFEREEINFALKSIFLSNSLSEYAISPKELKQ